MDMMFVVAMTCAANHGRIVRNDHDLPPASVQGSERVDGDIEGLLASRIGSSLTRLLEKSRWASLAAAA